MSNKLCHCEDPASGGGRGNLNKRDCFTCRFAMTICLYIVILFSNLLDPVVAFAQKSASNSQILRVSPVIMDIPLIPGKVITQTITLENMLDTPLPLQAKVEGFDTSDEEGGVQTAVSQTEVSPLVSWVKLDTTDFLIPPKGKKEVLFTVSVPAQVNVGGYYAVVFFTPLTAVTDAEVPQVIPKIGVILLANIGVPPDTAEKIAEIADFRFGRLVYDHSPVDLLLRVKNISLNYFSAKPRIILTRMLAGSSEEFQLPEKTILPGKIRRWELADAFGKRGSGVYKAHMLVSVGEGKEVKSIPVFFVILPYKMILIGILIITSILFVAIRRIRIIQALHIIMTGKEKRK